MLLATYCKCVTEYLHRDVVAETGSDKSVRVLLSIASFLCVVATGVLIASVFYYKEPPLQFLVVGDWGREGMYNQSEVAELMARVMGASPINCDKFIISTGNIVNAIV
jgi:hypothetical protein